MKTHVLRGSKAQIAENLAKISGEVREAIVFEEEPAPTSTAAAARDIFDEMRPYEAQGNTAVDDSREAVYSRVDGE
ncbi:MAG TPA: hypothetical protein VGI81_18190 [Tepidisphaeraceae bacterium]|jgi:hypothetical protein